MNTNETLEKFVDYLNRRYSERSTAKHYKSDLMIFQQTVENKLWEEISHKDVDQFVEKQHETGMSPATINRRLASLHTFFEWWSGEEPEKNKANPVLWRRHKIKGSELIPRDASDEDVESWFAVIESPRDRAIFGLMVGAGLRVSEVADLKQNALTPPPAPQQMARLRVWGKGKKERIAWLTPKLYAQVADWQTVRPPQTEDDHLFLNQHNRGLSKDGIQHRLKGYCQMAGIDITCHQLRHTFARRLAEQRMPVEAIAQVLGHSQVETTQRYINGADVNLRDQFQAVMAQLEAKPASEPSALGLPRLPSTPPVTEQADPAHLALALARFDSLAACPPMRLPGLPLAFLASPYGG